MSQPAAEARRLDSEAGIAVVLFNWTGAPLSKAVAVVRDGGRFPRISSVRHGPLQGEIVDRRGVRVSVPLDDVDVLLFEP